MSVPPLAGLEGQGCGALGCRGAAAGLLSALPQHSSSSIVPMPMLSSSPISITGAALKEVTLGFIAMGAVELAPLTSPTFSSHLFIVWEDLVVMASGHRPLPSHSLCGRVSFQMVTIQSVLLAVRQGYWMASIGLMEAYLQVPVPQLLVTFFASCSVSLSITSKRCALASPRLRRSSPGSWLLFRLVLHSMGIRMSRYLDDWLVQSSSRESLLEDLQTVLRLCHGLGIVFYPQQSNLVPSQVFQYLGVIIASTSLGASPSVERISQLLSTAAKFQSCASPTAGLWLSLLGVLSSSAHLIPGGRLRVRSLQLCLHRFWDRQDLVAPVYALMECLRDLQW